MPSDRDVDLQVGPGSLSLHKSLGPSFARSRAGGLRLLLSEQLDRSREGCVKYKTYRVAGT
eukprot:2324461-Rhodomonas_salina.2